MRHAPIERQNDELCNNVFRKIQNRESVNARGGGSINPEFSGVVLLLLVRIPTHPRGQP